MKLAHEITKVIPIGREFQLSEVYSSLIAKFPHLSAKWIRNTATREFHQLFKDEKWIRTVSKGGPTQPGIYIYEPPSPTPSINEGKG